MTRRETKAQKKNRIITAAARVFAEKGFSGTLIAEVAEQAGVGKGTVYEYFTSKEDLFFSVFEWFVEETGSQAKVSVSALGGPASKRIEALSDTLMRSWLEMEDLFSLAMEFWSASASSQLRDRFKQAFREVYSDFRGVVSALIRDGIERGEFGSEVKPDSVAAALVGTWDALILQAWFDDSFDPVATAGDFVAVVIRGMKIPGPQDSP
jgi:AcrR family transcriptional regulator